MIDLKDRIRDIKDFPKPGIVFKDITPLLADPAAFNQVIDKFVQRYGHETVDSIFAVESRGFLFGPSLAQRLSCSLVPVRKPGKLPFDTVAETYDLEYGTDCIEVHVDAVQPGMRVLVIDDLLATGGTAAATANLVKKLGADLVGAAFVVELAFLKGREKLDGIDVHSLIRY